MIKYNYVYKKETSIKYEVTQLVLVKTPIENLTNIKYQARNKLPITWDFFRRVKGFGNKKYVITNPFSNLLEITEIFKHGFMNNYYYVRFNWSYFP